MITLIRNAKSKYISQPNVHFNFKSRDYYHVNSSTSFKRNKIIKRLENLTRTQFRNDFTKTTKTSFSKFSPAQTAFNNYSTAADTKGVSYVAADR